ncbi:MAG: hypothetical protein V5A72_00540 [Candidatus Nanohaloarchaea archaeon]
MGIIKNLLIVMAVFSFGLYGYAYNHESTRVYIAETNGCDAEIYPYPRPRASRDFTGLMTTEISQCPDRETFEKVTEYQNVVTANSYSDKSLLYSILAFSSFYLMIKLEK